MNELKIGDIISLKELEGRRFFITKRVEGGFGIVYFLKSLSEFSNCVMKTFKNHVTYNDIEKEAFSWSQLGNNDFIAHFICYGTYNDIPYVLSKRYGATFDSLIGKNIDTYFARTLFQDIISALNYAHNKLNLIHRDIKPNNIFLDGDKPKVGDFGLAIYEKFDFKVDDNYQTYKKISEVTDGSFGGTFPFMAPELFYENPKFSVKTDIFAIGVTFFLLYSNGALPYDICKHIVFTDSFKQFDLNCKDEELKSIIRKCIAINPEERYQKYEDIPLFETQTQNNEEKEISSIINTIQLFRRENKIVEALAYAQDELLKHEQHPLLVNQISVIYRLQKKDDIFEKFLSDFFRNLQIKHDVYLYFDPLFTLANYYFSKDDSKRFMELIEPFTQYFKPNKIYLTQYPEYGIYLALKGYSFEAYESFKNAAIKIQLPPKYWLFFCCLCKVTNKYDEFSNIIQKQNGEFEKELMNETVNINEFDILVEQLRYKYKEFMNAIF